MVKWNDNYNKKPIHTCNSTSMGAVLPQVRNMVTGGCVVKLKEYSYGFFCAVFSPDGMHILTTSYNKTA